MPKYGPQTIQDQHGNALAGVTVTVLDEPGTSMATIYSDRDLTSVLTNPVVTDEYGNVEFWATPDSYTLKVTDEGRDLLSYVIELDDADAHVHTEYPSSDGLAAGLVVTTDGSGGWDYTVPGDNHHHDTKYVRGEVRLTVSPTAPSSPDVNDIWIEC